MGEKKSLISIRLWKSFLGKIDSSFLLFEALTDGFTVMRQCMFDTVSVDKTTGFYQVDQIFIEHLLCPEYFGEQEI